MILNVFILLFSFLLFTMKNILTTPKRFIILFIICSIVLKSNVFSQNSFFKEMENNDLTKHFISLKKLTSPIEEQYSSLDNREEGYIINKTILNGTYANKSLNASGNVIFNCEAGKYLNEIKNNLLIDFPELSSKITIYITRSSSFNAFATVNNTIYVNIGLLARLENEAQLAYILCHEIMHIVDKHIISRVLKIETGKSKYDPTDIVDNDEKNMLDEHAISREDEFQADLDGFRLYMLHKNYPVREALKALEILDKSNNFPFEIEKSTDIFFLSKADSLVSTSQENDSLVSIEFDKTSTHPSFLQRYDRIYKVIKSVDSTLFFDNNISIPYVPNDVFSKIIKDAKEELQKCYVLEQDFVSLFLTASYKLYEERDSSEENIKNLCHGAQGIINKKEKVNIEDPKLRKEFVNVINKFDTYKLHQWELNVYRKTLSEFPNLKSPKTYYNTALINIFNLDSNYRVFFPNVDFTSIQMRKISPIVLENIPFSLNLGAGVNLTNKQERKYQEYYSFQKVENKIAIVAINNISLSRKNLAISLNYADKLNSNIASSFEKLENNYPEMVSSFIPNSIKFSSYDYESYQLLNSWLSEKFKMENPFYVSYYADEIEKLYTNSNIRYLMTGINIEIKSFNGKQFATTFLSFIPFPIYIPQNILKLLLHNKRKYIFSVAFDLKTGDIVFWDKRTYLEPNTVAQLYQNYNDILHKINYIEK